MKFLKEKLRNWVFSEEYADMNQPVSAVRDRFSIDSYGFTLRVYKASGGTVIETNIYDAQNECHRNGLYVVTDEKDLGHELSKIITMENLKT